MKQRFRWILSATAVVAAMGGVSVRTQSAPPPILVVVNSAAANPYGGYLPEVLNAEGINSFTVAQLNTVTPTTLNGISLVVLAETALTSAQATTFSNYVAGGGRLIAMRPDSQLAPALGFTPVGSSTSEGYLGISNATLITEGFTSTTLPFHGTAQNITPASGTTVLANLYSDATTPTVFPAVLKSGRTVTWAYDLARSVVYTRQGNPANAGVDRDGLPPLRTNDVFYNAIDKDRVNIPYADVQMRLLTRVITELLNDVLPLPRLWYFPNANRTLMVVTGDSHANPQSYFDNL